MNTISNGINARGSPEKLLSNLIHKYHEDIPFDKVEVDLLKVNEEYGFLFGCGLVYRFLEVYYKGSAPSPQKAAVILSRAVLAAVLNGKFACDLLRRFDCEVKVDGKLWPFKNYATLLAGSVPSLGFGTKVFYEALKPRTFHSMAFSITPRDLVFQMPYLVRGKPTSCEDIIDSGAAEMEISFVEPQAYYLDGDMLPAEEKIKISLGPRITLLK